ncbi:MAG: molybdopterin molybdotransferase MoeA, partial [Alistipes sp.]|nr:molybdopterin molybdotransferase MoeA [Alistipes sp.]
VYAGVPPFANYCPVGEDIKKGDTVIQKNTRLSSVHVGLLASLGMERIPVRRQARVAILSTGTEIVQVGEDLPCGKIYNSTAYMLAADMEREGLLADSIQTCADEEELLLTKIRSALEHADFVITTGAVSVGKKDILPKVLENAGAKILFRGANIQPGTPTLASVLDGKVILSLSGNPYAAIANFELYFWPAMAKMMQSDSFEIKKTTAVLSGGYGKINKMRRLIRAYAQDGTVTIPSPVHASSVIHNLTECNCFIDLKEGTRINSGDEVVIRYFKGSR